MTCVTVVPAHAESDRPARRPFSSRSRSVKATPEAVSRQARLTLLAFRAHDDRVAALAFLHDHHDALGGRPIDAAGLDEPGLLAASALLPGQG
ncbi:hypothetical protein, partial [Sphingomonas bacterium]|uniref:hypothetical protein n=1 Tax=Sphingomonas bacterium TaxID=1895847 RepID=UPI003F68B5A5